MAEHRVVNRVTDRCVQLHDGYGYMREYRVARAWADGRVQSIYGRTTAAGRVAPGG
jgi:alkylation response protein AidB-like acyl-CoA dehydrogenase